MTTTPPDPQDKPPRDGCIEWKGIIQPNGYGRLHINNKAIGAHRIAWALANGRPPKRNKDICHTCDNRKCINPKHLFEGSRSENMRDAVSKNRMYSHNRMKKVCVRGHEFNNENTYLRKCGRRECRECHRIRNRNYFRRLK